MNSEQLKNLDYALSYKGLFESAKKCSKGVKWKGSVAYYLLNISKQTYKLYTEIHNGTYKEREHQTFIIREPKERVILNLAFRDRVYQRSLCDNVIYPEMSKHFIYGNCACQKGKGTKFAKDLLKRYIYDFKFKTPLIDRYILHIDISKYYPTMSHKVAINTFSKYLCKDVMKYVKPILDKFEGEKGFDAGGQIVQILGISVLSDLDHYCKEKLKIKYYIRYMDDIIILGNKNDLELWLQSIKDKLKEIDFDVSIKKTKIEHLTKGTEFLGFIFKMKGNRLLVLPKKGNLKNRRRKLRKLFKLKVENIDNMQQCYYAHLKYASNKSCIRKMKNYYKELKNGYSKY